MRLLQTNAVVVLCNIGTARPMSVPSIFTAMPLRYIMAKNAGSESHFIIGTRSQVATPDPWAVLRRGASTSQAVLLCKVPPTGVDTHPLFSARRYTLYRVQSRYLNLLLVVVIEPPTGTFRGPRDPGLLGHNWAHPPGPSDCIASPESQDWLCCTTPEISTSSASTCTKRSPASHP